METQLIAIIVITSIVVALLIFYIFLTVKQPKWVEKEYNPKLNGLTHDPESSFYHSGDNKFCITLDDGNQMAWHTRIGETAYEALLKGFNDDREKGRLPFSDDIINKILLKCEHLEDNGWPAWDMEYQLTGLSVMAETMAKTKFKPAKDSNINIGAKAVAAKEASNVNVGVKQPVSSCCKVALKKGHQNAKRCSKCNRFCKAI